jgi:hypothetical protein
VKPHPRIRKTIKWGGAVVALLLVAIWVWSGWRYAYWNGRHIMVGVSCGRVVADVHDSLTPPEHRGLHSGDVAPNPAVGSRFWNKPAAWRAPGLVGGVIPMWCIVPATVLVSTIAWRLDAIARARAAVPRCPRCGYDRTGLPLLAECPECGSGNPQGILKPLRAAVEAHGTNALIIFAMVGGLLLLWAIVRAYL